MLSAEQIFGVKIYIFCHISFLLRNAQPNNPPYSEHSLPKVYSHNIMPPLMHPGSAESARTKSHPISLIKTTIWGLQLPSIQRLKHQHMCFVLP